MAARNRGRYLAPIAMLVVIAAVVLVVQGQLAKTHHHSRPHNDISGLVRKHTKKAPAPTFYVVKSGDSLSVISVRTGVPVATLESLNSGVNPNALQTGQRLRLR